MTSERLNQGGNLLTKTAYIRFVYFAWTILITLVVWGHFARIEQVVKAQGRVVPSNENQIVQHFEGGIVKRIFVEEGDLVKKGDLILTVENSFSNAELQKATLELYAEEAKALRLAAETNDKENIIFPSRLKQHIPEVIKAETELFAKRKTLYQESVNILNEQVVKAKLTLSGNISQKTNKQKEINILNEKYNNLKKLEDIGAISKNELLTMQSELQRLRSLIEELGFKIPITRSELKETQARLAEAKSRRQADAKEELSKSEIAIKNIHSSLIAMKERSKRSEVRATSDGIINKLFITTEGGVVRPGGELFELVSTNKSIIIEAKIAPKDRAKIYNGLPALIKVSAYEFTIHGALKGLIKNISADTFQEESGEVFFRIRLETESNNLGKDKPIVAGMMADIDIVTGKRSILSYLLKPLNRARAEAFRS